MRRSTILIVEDDRDLSTALAARLKSSGFAVVCAGDAVDGIHKVQDQRIDLILLDIGLPGGDGFEVVELVDALRAATGTPVVVMSGRDPESLADRAHACGVFACLQKPIDPQLLVGTIERALESGKAAVATTL